MGGSEYLRLAPGGRVSSSRGRRAPAGGSPWQGAMYMECTWSGRRAGGSRRLTGPAGSLADRCEGRPGGSLMLAVGMTGVRRGVFTLTVAKDAGRRRVGTAEGRGLGEDVHGRGGVGAGGP